MANLDYSAIMIGTQEFIATIKLFFYLDFWDVVEKVFTVLGVFSTGLAIVRFVHESKLKMWKNNFHIKDYAHDYDVEHGEDNAIYTKLWDDKPTTEQVTVVFKPIDCVIRKLEIIPLNADGTEKKTIETIKNITPEDSICFRLERAECIPKYIIRWYAEYGEFCEHHFHENLRNGRTEVTGAVYSATFMSVIRKIIGLK